MRATLATFLLLCLTLSVVQAQTAATTPFAEFEKQVRAEPAGFAGNKERLSTFFNEERKHLGDRFEAELLKYIGSDVEKHYWISFFLESESYLHGSKPLPHLSLLIKQQGLALLAGKTDEESRGRTVGLSATAAVLSEQLGFRALAVSHKDRVDLLLAESAGLNVYFPGMLNEERAIYRAIPSSVRGAVFSSDGAQDESEPKATVSAGILNGKGINKAVPTYPPDARSARASGEVRVRVVFDETGKVIWARAVSGHSLLQAAAVEAAYRTTFEPVKLSDKPVKVSGVLLYNFNP